MIGVVGLGWGGVGDVRWDEFFCPSLAYFLPDSGLILDFGCRQQWLWLFGAVCGCLWLPVAVAVCGCLKLLVPVGGRLRLPMPLCGCLCLSVAATACSYGYQGLFMSICGCGCL